MRAARDNYKQILYIPEKYGYVLSCDMHHYLSLGGDPFPPPLKPEHGDSHFS